MRVIFMTCFLVNLCLAEIKPQELFDAANMGDLKKIEAIIESGFDVETKDRYGRTALFLSATKGHVEIVKYLLEKNAKTDLKDTFYGGSLLSNVVSEGYVEIMKLLLEKGANALEPGLIDAAASGKHFDAVKILAEKGADPTNAFYSQVTSGEVESVTFFLEHLDMKKDALAFGRRVAEALKKNDVVDLFEKRGVPSVPSPISEDKLGTFAGLYRDQSGRTAELKIQDGNLTGFFFGTDLGVLIAKSESELWPSNLPSFPLIFSVEDEKELLKAGKPVRFTLTKDTTTSDPATESTGKAKVDEVKPTTWVNPSGKVAKVLNWPSFRGENATGIADGQFPPTAWDMEKSENLRWKTPIPGLGHGSPVLWDNQLYVVTAVSDDADAAQLRVGLYGNVAESDDIGGQRWMLFAVDATTGNIMWERVAHSGKPKVARHTKASHANSSPVTDGKHIVALFGAEGLYCYDVSGNLLWRKDLGKLDGTFFYDENTQWGHGSSPIIHEGKVILQCDKSRASYLIALDVKTGNEIWKIDRDEIPSWGTPTVVKAETGDELITNGTNYIRAYDPANGKELWKLKCGSEITVPTPFVHQGLVYVTAGYRPVQPIFAIKPGHRGDISLKKDEKANDAVAWSTARGGPYLPTPIAYQGLFYVLSNRGNFTCYDGKTGERVYRQRIRGAYTASLVAADGRIYATDEYGMVTVIKAGREFKVLAKNPVGETCMTTPLISNGTFYILARDHLFAIGKK